MGEEAYASFLVDDAGDVPGHVVGTDGCDLVVCGPDGGGFVCAGGFEVGGFVMPEAGEAGADKEDIAGVGTGVAEAALEVVGGEFVFGLEWVEIGEDGSLDDGWDGLYAVLGEASWGFDGGSGDVAVEAAVGGLVRESVDVCAGVLHHGEDAGGAGERRSNQACGRGGSAYRQSGAVRDR